jgi:DNA mismatch repair ATPase MutS
MKAFLMYSDRDFNLEQKPPWNNEALEQDLELLTLYRGMAGDDSFLFQVAQSAVLTGLDMGVETIRYRQNILKDCLRESQVVRGLYDLSIRASETPKKIRWGILGIYPDSILSRSIDIMAALIPILKELRSVAEQQADRFQSEGFKTLFALLRRELTDEYFASILDHLKELKFRGGVLVTAQLGHANRGANYVLRRPRQQKWNWSAFFSGEIFTNRPLSFSYHLHPRDDQGARALSELKDRGIHLAANALAQAVDHILSFFHMLRTELGFYVGCLNLHDRLTKKGEPTCFPVPVEPTEHHRVFTGLYDVCLAMHSAGRLVGNDLSGDRKDLVIITGANQGGKSTFLRSIGLAQLMMQCGMFVPAMSFSATVCNGLYTHFRRAEDATMKSGKFDEELSRMSEIVDHLAPNSLILFNESFSATNEREGSELAKQIVSALLEKRVQIFFVTHLFTFARRLYDKNLERTVFLRAERGDDGTRSFKILEGEPLETSYGEDLYKELFDGQTQTQRRESRS